MWFYWACRLVPRPGLYVLLPSAVSANVLLRALLHKTSNLNTVNKWASLWYDNAPSSFCCYANGVDRISNHFQAFSEEKKRREAWGWQGGGVMERYAEWQTKQRRASAFLASLGLAAASRWLRISLTEGKVLRSWCWALGRFRPGWPAENLSGVMDWRLQDAHAFPGQNTHPVCLTQNSGVSDPIVVQVPSLNISIYIDLD